MDTVFQTVLAGTLVFVVGQIIQNFILKPIQEYKRIVGKIDAGLLFYENILLTTIETKLDEECRHYLRKLASELACIYNIILFKHFSSAYLGIIACGGKIIESVRDLRFLSNNVPTTAAPGAPVAAAVSICP